MQSVLAGFRLSPLQRRLWSLSLGSKDFRAQAAILLQGDLDRLVLETAVRKTCEQHEVLRTVFPRLPGMENPLQEVKEDAAVDFGEAPRGDGGAAWQELLALEADGEMSLERGPLLRCTLQPVSPRSHLLLITLPALCADRETLHNLAREIARNYQEAFQGGSVSRELTQYIDFSEWQNDLGETEESEKGRMFWKQQNLASLPSLDLPLPAPSAVADPRWRSVQIRVAGCPQAGETEPVRLLAAWELLLWRVAGSDRLVVNALFDGRRIEPLQEALGLFGSYLPIPVSLREDLRFSELVEELRIRLEGMREWQEYFPWDSPEGLMDAQYLSSPQIGFEYVRWPGRIEAGPLTFELLHLSSLTERFRLKLTAVRRDDRSDELDLELSYDGARFEELDVRRLARQLEILLSSALTSPESRIGELELLSAEDRHQLLREWNDSSGVSAEGRWLHRLVEERASASPESLAVISEGESLSYGELNARANRLARHLRRLGVELDSRVGLFTDRSVEMVVGILGVMKAGGAYVPLDPVQPKERLRLMLEELKLRVVLARESWLGSLPLEGLEVVVWEGLEEKLAELGVRDLGIEVDGDNLAYVLFTSGSTGRPKGVMVRHGGLANLALALEERIYRGEGGRVGVNAPLVFDGSVKQLAQLAWGRTLALVPESVRPDGEALWRFLVEGGVEVVDCTPSQLRLLLDGGLEGSGAAPLSRVLVGGEEIVEGLWQRLESMSWVEYHNVYGPTECTVDATSQRVSGSRPSIGRPLLNVRVYLLDRGLRPVPLGLSGEICVGGSGLARGYAGRPDLTAERFVPDPFSGVAGSRLYRTGDLARYLDDGRVEYLGRIDHQVKLRGVRIELGEVESVLEQHPRVRSAVAMVREDRSGDRRLVGYVVPRSGGGNAPGGRALYPLPNGVSIAQLNRIETDYLYREIFEENCYLRHGVSLPEGSCVLDVGANIGMFTLFASRQSPGARIFAFEPIGEIYETLQFNASRCSAQVTCLPYGLGEEERSEIFTYYPQFSARSGVSEYADAADEVEVIKRYIGNEKRLGVEGAGELLEQVDELVAGRFVGELQECRVRPLSQVIREEGIERIDLLKIDVQRAELRVLEGISEEDWSRIGQLAMEAHDAPGGASEGRVGRILDLLSRQGFEAVVEQDELLVGTDRYNVFAVRRDFEAWRAQRPQAVRSRGLLPLVEVSPESSGEGLYTLPNRLRVQPQNRNEADFIYQQIFVDRVYQRHGIDIQEGDCIFDVGANIGLFTLYAHQWPGVRVHSFEPIPSNFEKLRSNVERYGCPARLYPCGLGRERSQARFTFYPKWSASSGQYADPSADLESARVFLLNRDRDLESYADEILEGRFEGESVECELRTLSDVIREGGVERIDLLKLDVEKSELDILLGLEESDWPKVQQAVLEVHDIDGRLEQIHDLLARHGFDVAVEQDELAVGTGIYNLYARRAGLERLSSASPEVVPQPAVGAELTVSDLQSFLKDRLPEFMLPSDLVILEDLPYTRSGKVDRLALPAPEQVRVSEVRAVTGPRDPFEEVLVGIWSEVLQKSPVDIHDNFFELGGHSLLATQLISRVRSAFSIELPLRTLFEHPTVADLGREVRRVREAGQGVSAPPIVAVPRTGDLPLSFAQQRLWFIDQLEPGSAVYNCPHPLRLSGALDLGLLSRTLLEIVRRHESLRTRFGSVDGRPVQIIESPKPLAVPRVDLSGLSQEAREAEAQRLATEDAQRPFDLSRGPLLRVGVVHLGPEDHVILFTMHHIVSDGRSMEVLVREVAALYGSFLENKPSPLPELPVQYADFAAWQRSWLSGEALEAEVSYWRGRLSGAPPVLDLPLDRPRSGLRQPSGSSLSFRLEPSLAQSLRELSRRQGVTLFMTLLAAFQTLLARYSNQEDLCLGIPIAGRNREETEKLIGFFINTLVIRGDLSGNPGFLEFLGRIKSSALDAYAHQDAPFEKLVEELAPERSLASSPLFQVLFALEDNPGRSLNLPGLLLRPLPTRLGVTKFDLMLGMLHVGEEIAGSFGYASALFDEVTIGRMAEHLKRMLEGLARDPDLRVMELPLLSDEEWRQTLSDRGWSAPASVSELCFHEAFAAHAARAPEAVALEVDGREWSYGELDRWANRLAHRLRELGVGPETRVGVCLERSAELVASLLAVLKAGGAFVPLDPSYPETRRAWIAQDSDLSVLVTSESVERPLGEAGSNVRLLLLEAEGEALARLSEEAPAPAASPGNLAYVIYTSGTTGNPKGVMVEHRQWMYTLGVSAELYGVTPADSMACMASFSFDISLLELGLPLVTGGRVLLLRREEVLDAAQLVDRLDSATLMNAVPSLQRSLIERLRTDSRRLGALRMAFVGGEAVERELLVQMREAFAPARVVVLYGPTEATLICAGHEIAPEGQPAGRRIGAPLPGVELRMVDRAGFLTPLGVGGELWVGGPLVSRGYLGRPELTADRFRPAAGGERFYRTGDLVRYANDGALEFLGRFDDQVKVRGFRIELGEIESALLSHPRVEEAVVAVRVDGGESRLVAFVTGEETEPAALREHVSRTLPAHMVPSLFVVLEAMPLLPNGKVDRRNLAQRDLAALQAPGERLAPRTPTEELMANLWSEVLKREQVGVNESFFELGGHSLMATQLMSRVRNAFGLELPLRALFERPTVAGLARAVEEAQRTEQGRLAPPIVPVERTGDLPLSFAQERLWFLDQLEPGRTTYNMPLALRVEGPLSVAVLARSLAGLAARQEALRTRFASREGRPVQTIDPAGPISVPVVELEGLQPEAREAEVRRLAAEERERPFDLERGPLMRVLLLRLAAGEWGLLFTLHHAVSDAWSMGVLVREVSALYSGFSCGEEPALPALPIQYADFAAWQRSWLSGEVLERETGFWRQQLAGVPPVLDLPLDRPRPRVQVLRGARRSVELAPELAESLRTLAKRQGVTLFMLLLASWQALLARWSGSERLAVGAPIAGRNRLETEGLIGFFINTLVLPADLSGEPGFLDLLSRCCEVCLGAFAHQDLPFEKLVEELQPERSLAHSPLFQVAFALQNTPSEALEVPDLRLTPLVPAEARESGLKFDLDLVMGERQGRLAATLGYNQTLFDGATAARLLGGLVRMLEGLARDPGARVAELPLLSDEEWRQAVSEWGWSAPAPAPERCFHEAFAAHAARAPEAVALEMDGREWSYGELNRRANRLAHRLRELGVGPETRVGVCLERSAELVASLLAVLKAGGAFVPLDPSYPEARRAWIAGDAALSVLVTSRGVERPLGEASGTVRVLTLEAEEDALARCPETDPEPVSSPHHLAYVIYTSGSTGLPKGVMVEHRNWSHTLAAAAQRFGPGPGDRMACLASFSFDISLLELGLPLLAGGRVLLVGREDILDMARLADRLAPVTLLHGVPSLMRPLVERLRSNPRSFADLRTVFVGGEAVDGELLARMREVFAPARLVVLYGPTESTIIGSSWEVSPEGEPAGRRLGRPLPGVELRVVERAGLPAPLGAAGELWIGGPGVSRGYLGRPDLTADRFRPGPGGVRSYRTGDLARHAGDGTLEFLGRVDAQVKVRGFRVEPGEIESVLLAHPQVREAAVGVRAEGGDTRLVAFVSGEEPEVPSLREHVSRSLPSHMVPSQFVVLESLPLLPNGKVDRRSLDRRDPGAPQVSGEWLAPRTPTEELMAELWSEVLRRERVGVSDNFFELGGHSLLATQLISRVRGAFGLELPLRALFERPTVEGLSRAVEEARQSGQASPAPPIVPVERTADLPLSFAQERLWFHHQLEPGSLIYNLPTAVRVSGDLDVAVLWRSLSEIERRHEALRTTFGNVDGRPFQRVHPAPFCAWPVIDLSGLPADRREPLAVQLAEREAKIPFDLDRGPLLRFGLVRLEPREHVALLTMHHAISDRWSMGIFFRELKALYDAFGERRTSPLPELPVQYPDYSHWQRQWLSGEVLEAQVAHWREELAGAPAVLDLPTDRPRVPVPVFQGDRCAFRLSRETSNALRSLSRGEGVTLFMAVLAVFQTLLARVSNTVDVSVGTPIAGRGRLEIERLIGFFVNTLVLRGRLEDGPGFRELLRRTREATLRAYEHQDLPFEKLVEELRPARSLAHTPLFQAMLVFQNASRESLPAASPASSLTLSPLDGQARDAWAQFDLTLVVQEDDEELSGSLQYRRSLFDESTVRRLLTLFERLVEAGVADPGRSLAEAELVREEERRQVVQGRIGAASAEPGSGTVVRRIAERAAQAPGAPAILSAAATLSYGEMERRSNQLAHLLVRRGCGRGTLVGLHLERSPEMVVALLAILKTGAAYLPLDPAYPRHRLELMLRDSGAGLVLTRERLLAGLSTDGLPSVCLDREAEALARESAGTPGGGPEPVDLAYVIYTSGSTGTPKGTLLRHLGLDNTVAALVQSFEIGPGDRVLQFASMSFDAAVAEIFVALCSGAALCLVERESAMPGEDLARRMREMEVSFTTLPPSVLAVTPSEDLPRLRTLVAVGEALPLNVAERWAAGRRFVNGYGPTEVTVCATLSDGLRPGRQHPGIGRPIANVEVALLDARGLLVPTGVAGELCVGGVGLAVGYLNRPGLTAERFIPDPFGAAPGGRLYRTGDLARQLEDGGFEFLGRVDRQVKVRGFRIELEEVEAALVRYPGISQAAVVTRERGADDVRLIAYVASAGEVATAGLRSFLESELPAYMIPSAFVPLAELPLTRNGKLDRSALPEPEEEPAAPAAGSLAPRDELESRLTRVWQELLGVQTVGVRDNFFELGGHSLLAVQLISRVEQETGHKLPLSILFQAPTVEAMANAIRARQQGLGLSCLVPIQPRGSLAPLFLTHPVGGNLFCYRSLVREIGGDRPVYGLQSVGLDGEEAPYTTVEDMAAHYLEELKKAQPEGPYHLCGWSSGGVIAYEVAQQLKRRGDKVATLVLIDTRVSDEADRSITRDPALLLNLFALDFGLSLDRFQLSWDEISELTPYQQLSYILDAAKAEGAVPPEIEVDQVLRYFQVFKTNLEAMTRYQPKPYAGRMLLMRTRDPRPAGPRRQGIGWWGQLLSRAGYLRRHLRLKWQLLFNPAQGWDKLAREGVEVVVIPGSHFSILQPPHSRGLAERLREILAKGDRPR